MINLDTIKKILEGANHTELVKMAQDLNASGLEVSQGYFSNNIDAIVGNMVQVKRFTNTYETFTKKLEKFADNPAKLARYEGKMAALLVDAEKELVR